MIEENFFIHSEDKVIKDGLEIIKNNNEQLDKKEYQELLKNYQKLYKRSMKIIKLSDTQQKLLDDMNENLEKKVEKEVTRREIQETILIQQSKMAAMGEMIGAIGHQWQQPITGLSLMIQDLKFAYEDEELDEKYIDKFIDDTLKQIDFMRDTINDFKNFFKPSKEKYKFEIKKSIEDIIKLLSYQLKKNYIRVELNVEKEINILGYPNDFKQVILNILNNAKDAILEYREKINDRMYEGVIEVNIKLNKKKIIIIINDNACGIDEHILDKIFESYTTTKGQKGTGIGLYMSKFIIEQMRGKLFARNKKSGNGAEFVIEFPSFIKGI